MAGMDEKLREKLLSARGCGECVIDLAENLVNLCQIRGQGEPCKEKAVESVKEFVEDKISGEELIVKLKTLFGQNYVIGETEREKREDSSKLLAQAQQVQAQQE
jgi:hypothetical protein